jgi:hypothetical protein
MPPSEAVRALLAGVIDYAGLFPPAALDMAGAAAQYAAYRRGADAWALGRFVVPIARVEELVHARTRVDMNSGAASEPWRLSVLADLSADTMDRLRTFNAQHAGSTIIDSVETRLAADADATVLNRLAEIAGEVELFAEIPIDGDPDDLVRIIKRASARAKVRTGGVKPELFPRSHDLACFIMRCVEHDVPFKATAGLHHPLRARYPLTYERDAEQGMMFGFLNVLLAAALLRAGCIGTEAETVTLLEANDARALHFDDSGVTWARRNVSVEQLREARTATALSFGSCSFEEPVQDLRTLALL